MSEENQQQQIEVKVTDSLQLSTEGNHGIYSLIIPIGAQFEEAINVASHFTSMLAATWENQKKLEKEKNNEENKDGEGKSE